MALEPWVQESGHLKNLQNHFRDLREGLTVPLVLLYVPFHVCSELCVTSLILKQLCLDKLEHWLNGRHRHILLI